MLPGKIQLLEGARLLDLVLAKANDTQRGVKSLRLTVFVRTSFEL